MVAAILITVTKFVQDCFKIVDAGVLARRNTAILDSPRALTLHKLGMFHSLFNSSKILRSYTLHCYQVRYRLLWNCGY